MLKLLTIQKHVRRRIWFFTVGTKTTSNIVLILLVASGELSEIVGITRRMHRGIAQTLNRPGYFELRQSLNKEGVCIIYRYAHCF